MKYCPTPNAYEIPFEKCLMFPKVSSISNSIQIWRIGFCLLKKKKNKDVLAVLENTSKEEESW